MYMFNVNTKCCHVVMRSDIHRLHILKSRLPPLTLVTQRSANTTLVLECRIPKLRMGGESLGC